jgi:single-stranded DNA-binding protein
MLSQGSGEFGVVNDPELKFGANGGAYMDIRGVNKKRVRDSNGNWSDGEPTFMDIRVIGKTAEHLFESIAKGDSIIAIGDIEGREYEKDGQRRTSYRLVAHSVGVSTRWHPVKTPKALESSNPVALVTDVLGAEVVDAPF